MPDVRVAAIQLSVGLSQDADLARAADFIAQAAGNGVNVRRVREVKSMSRRFFSISLVTRVCPWSLLA